MSTYVKLRKKIHIKTQAVTKLTAQKSQKQKDLMYSISLIDFWGMIKPRIDLLLCRISEEEQAAHGNGERDFDEEDQRRHPPRNMFQTVKANLEKLDVIQYLLQFSQTLLILFSSQSTSDSQIGTVKHEKSLKMNSKRWKKRLKLSLQKQDRIE